MSNHFLAIGFPIREPQDFAALLKVASEAGRWISTERGYYIHWGPDDGVEFWGQANSQRQLMGGHPHFVGNGRIRMAVESYRAEPTMPLDGMVLGMINPAADGSGGDYPLAVSLTDADLFREHLCPGAIVTLQVAAFVEQGECFGDDQDFTARGGEMAKLAPEALIPIGLFTPDGGHKEPEPKALMTGHIESPRLVQNKLSDEKFWAFSLRTLGGWFDVVADPALLKGTPNVAGVFCGVCYLSGQVAPNSRCERNKMPLVSRPGIAGDEVQLTTATGVVPAVFRPAGRSYGGLALIALLLAIPGVCFPPLGTAALICGGLALFFMNGSGNWQGWWRAAVATVLGLAATAVLLYMLL